MARNTYTRAYTSAFVFVNCDLERGGSGGARVKRRVSSRSRKTGGFS